MLELETVLSPRSLARRQADLAIRWTQQPEADLVGRRLVRVPFSVYGASTLVDAGRRPLSDYPWLGFTDETPAKDARAFMQRHAPKARVVCRYESLLPLLAAIRAGAGVGFMPRAFADPDPALVRLHDGTPSMTFECWALAHPDLRGAARVRYFLQHAAAYFEGWSDRYTGNA